MGRQFFKAFLADTPGKMRALRIGSVIVVLVVAFAAGGSVAAQRNAFASARDNAAQLVRVGVIRTSLVEADAVATNTFLQPGVEPEGSRARYEAAINAASTTVADAAVHSRADGVALQRVNDALVRYAGLIESARSTNRQGLPVGVAYVKQASQLAREVVLPELTTIAHRHENAVDSAVRRVSTATAVHRGVTVVGLLAVGFVLVWLLLRTRRWINVPYAAAFAFLLVSAVVAGLAVRVTQNRANEAYRTDYAEGLTLLQARANAFDARSAESLTLIARGSGVEFDARFDELIADALAQSNAASGADPTAAAVSLTAYARQHQAIRALDDAGKWEAAVTKATATGKGTASQAFDAFASANERAVEHDSRAVAARFDDAVSTSNIAVWIALGGGLIAALLCLLGMSARLKEYS